MQLYICNKAKIGAFNTNHCLLVIIYCIHPNIVYVHFRDWQTVISRHFDGSLCFFLTEAVVLLLHYNPQTKPGCVRRVCVGCGCGRHWTPPWSAAHVTTLWVSPSPGACGRLRLLSALVYPLTHTAKTFSVIGYRTTWKPYVRVTGSDSKKCSPCQAVFLFHGALMRFRASV